jgi:heme-degrading monooxygenase HmoA
MRLAALRGQVCCGLMRERLRAALTVVSCGSRQPPISLLVIVLVPMTQRHRKVQMGTDSQIYNGHFEIRALRDAPGFERYRLLAVWETDRHYDQCRNSELEREDVGTSRSKEAVKRRHVADFWEEAPRPSSRVGSIVAVLFFCSLASTAKS